MTDTNDITRKLLHELVHQEMEKKGMAALGNECIPLMTVILLTVRESGLKHAQILGTLSALPRLLKATMCDQCQEMAGRIEELMVQDFARFVNGHKKGG